MTMGQVKSDMFRARCVSLLGFRRVLCQIGAMRLLILLLMFPFGAMAAPMTPEEFDRATQGRTLFYSNGGQIYGVERYLPNREVIWSFDDGRCQTGRWYPQDGQICFVYDREDTRPQCWVFEQGPQGLIAYFEGQDPATRLMGVPDVGRDMICLGPEVGV